MSHLLHLLPEHVDGAYMGLPTEELIETCAYMSHRHPNYGLFAGRVRMYQMHQTYPKDIFSLYTSFLPGMLSPKMIEMSQTYRSELNAMVDWERDFTFDYMAVRVLEKTYLMPNELPQFMYLRVAMELMGPNLDEVKKCYDNLSTRMFTFATPTLINAGRIKNQMSSCFLSSMKDDSIAGIFETLKECAQISQTAGGLGVHVHNIRSAGSYIASSNGHSSGLVPMCRVWNNMVRYVDQGGGKRKGACAMYLEPWHADIFEFIALKRNTGKDDERARDLFYGLWIPDLFMQQVVDDGDWYLMDPAESPYLADLNGKEFEKLYAMYVDQGLYKRKIQARELWHAMLDSMIETGVPYMLFKDACNRKSNQQNLGTIKCSNLCAEIVEYSSPTETAVCNLASLTLPSYVKDGTFDFNKLDEVTYQLVRCMNKVIDNNYYPVESTRRSNMKNRPLGIGVNGLADIFQMLKIDYDSPEAMNLQTKIFAHIYYSAMLSSVYLAAESEPYQSYHGSPLSKGQLQCDLWGVTPDPSLNWDLLRTKLKEYGARNSLLVAVMPTASTSQLLGSNECTEPFMTNVLSKKLLSGEYVVLNKHLVQDLMELGLWTGEMENRLILANGSVQDILEIPADIRSRYKTAWEISQKTIIDMASARGPYVCQSQSMNLFMSTPTYGTLSSMLIYSWKSGLKTGCYYLRTKPAVNAIKFTTCTACSS